MTDIMIQDVLIGAVADFPDGEIRPASMPDGTALAVYNVDGTASSRFQIAWLALWWCSDVVRQK